MTKFHHHSDEKGKKRNVVADATSVWIPIGEFEENRSGSAAEIVNGHRFLPLLSKEGVGGRYDETINQQLPLRRKGWHPRSRKNGAPCHGAYDDEKYPEKEHRVKRLRR